MKESDPRTSDATKRAWLVCAMGTLLAALPAAAQLEVRITADNAYRLGIGPAIAFSPVAATVENTQSSDINSCSNGPEVYSIPNATPAGYLYILAYADQDGTQGVLGQFQFGTNPPIYTGSGPWEVCATGHEANPGGPALPSMTLINAQLLQCNNGDPVLTSTAWVNTTGTAIGRLQFGDDNGATYTGTVGDEFKQVCTIGPAGIDPQAQWMWYNWNPATLWDPATNPTGNTSAFMWPGGAANTDEEYLIFRLPLSAVPGVVPPCPVVDVAMQYSAKFVCYQAVEAPLAHVRGFYGTAINVHNPSLASSDTGRVAGERASRVEQGRKLKPAFLAKKVAVALPGETIGPISPYRFETIPPDGAFEIDCADILRMAGAPPNSFLTGFLVIDADQSLDVEAVYTARSQAGQVSTIDVETIPEREMHGRLEVCPP